VILTLVPPSVLYFGGSLFLLFLFGYTSKKLRKNKRGECSSCSFNTEVTSGSFIIKQQKIACIPNNKSPDLIGVNTKALTNHILKNVRPKSNVERYLELWFHYEKIHFFPLCRFCKHDLAGRITENRYIYGSDLKEPACIKVKDVWQHRKFNNQKKQIAASFVKGFY